MAGQGRDWGRSRGRGRGRSGAGIGTGSGYGGARQGREVRINAKGNALSNAGHRTLQDIGMMDCGTGWRAGQSGRRDREEDRAL